MTTMLYCVKNTGAWRCTTAKTPTVRTAPSTTTYQRRSAAARKSRAVMPPHRWCGPSSDLLHGLDQLRRQVEVGGGLALLVDVAVDALDLGGRETGGLGDLLDRPAGVLAVPAEVHQVPRQGEVELLLGLRQRVRVGRRRPGADLLGDAEEVPEREFRGLVEVGD